MKPTALIYALWEKNLPVLTQYLQGRNRVVFVPDYMINDTLRQAVQEAGSELIPLPLSADLGMVEEIQPLLERVEQNGFVCELSPGATDPRVKEALLQALRRDLPAVRGLFKVLDDISAMCDIEITLLNEDVLRDGKSLALWSRRKKIPVLQVVHGTGMGRDYIGEEVVSDYLALPSNRSVEYFLDLGVPAGNLFVVGEAGWDVIPAMSAKRDEIRASVAASFNLPLDGQWIVWGSTWNAGLSFLDDRDSLQQMMEACLAIQQLREGGFGNAWLVYKDRVTAMAGADRLRENFFAVAEKLGVGDCVRYAVSDSKYWAAAGDAVVSYDSNLSIEAVLAGTPAINVLSDFGSVAGGSFGANDGVLTLEAQDVALALAKLIADAEFRKSLLEAAAARREFFNAGVDGKATSRLVELVDQLALRFPEKQGQYVWQEYLSVESHDVTAGYHTTGRQDLIDMIANRPKLMLDIGCAGGANGALAKLRFPDCQVWGIETNKAAAELASRRLDKVLVGMFEDFDLEREGIAKGSLDMALLADVLEHMYDPWRVMVKLREYLSEKGQVVVSIPNVRNLVLIGELMKGNWTYAREGLLDITHIRFFTEKEIQKFCRETGYRVLAKKNALDTRLLPLMERAQGSLPCNIEVEKMVIKNVTHEEMQEMCTLQFYLLLEKA
ncbi:class I SAM-dependent methyltransferase [Chromobacterium phragmitis]|nr:methyltransferase domain-containing protein [Chromobacterium phragmitis]